MNRFDLVASTWDSNSKRVQIALHVTQNILKHTQLHKDMRVLDYGCGTGLLGLGLSEYVHFVDGMDSSSAMIEEFNTKTKTLGINNAEASFHDITQDDLKSNHYDMIVSSMTLHHIPNTAEFISKCAISLKNGGYLCLSDLESEDGTFHEHGNDGVYHFGFDKQYIKNLFEQAGLEMVFVDTVHTVSKAKDFNIFLAIGRKNI